MINTKQIKNLREKKVSPSKQLLAKLMLPKKLLAAVIIGLSVSASLSADKRALNLTSVVKASEPILIDAQANEGSWNSATWRNIDQLLLGEKPEPDDFSGRYKLLWDSEALYMFLEVTDDVLIDTHPDPLVHYWDDDCAEIFIDEDGSGGNHQFTYNAFAYHVGLDRNVSDMGPTATSDESEIQTYNEHIQSQWTRSPESNIITWEFKIYLYDDTFLPNSGAIPVSLKKGKKLGFMFAYCDADQSIDGKSTREHFMGSFPIEGINGNKDLGYIDASVFEPMILK